MRFLILALIAVFCTPFSFAADAKKVKDKIKKAEAEFAHYNFNGAEKNLKDALEEDPTSIDAHLALADLYSATRRNPIAAQEYTKALELDDQQKKLTAVQRRRAIDQQGVCYALARNLDRAKQIYLDALAKDPDYAMFNYNLACVYAELGDLDSAIPYLKKSWENRDTLPGDTKYPDPRKDDSFKRYWNDPRFQEAVGNIVM
jgi:Tfp pilus assembly protein PilF